MYAVPSSPFSFSPDELAQMRKDVAAAEAEAARATSWAARTRAEQQAKSLRGLIRGGEIERQVEAAHAAVNRARPTTMTFQRAIERGVAAGRYAPSRPHYAEQATTPTPATTPEDALARAKTRLTELDALIADPATDAASVMAAKIHRREVLVTIEAITQALEQRHRGGTPQATGNAADPRAPEAAPTVPSATELQKLVAEAGQLQVVVDDPAASVAIRTNAQMRLTAVRLRIGEIFAALHPVTEVGAPAIAGNTLTFDQLARLVEDARKAGVVASYDIRRPKQTA